MDTIEKIVDVYKNKSNTTIASVVAIIFGVGVLIWFQTEPARTLPTLIDRFPVHGKRIMIEYTLNLFAGIFQLGLSIGWGALIFNSNHYYSYSYNYSYNETNPVLEKVVYGITSLAFLIFGMSFFVYMFAKLSILVLISVILIAYVITKK
ncbi:hypothetical protein D3C75_1064120 [compost metagenome]